MNKKEIFENAEQLCNAAAAYIVNLSNKCIAKKGRFTIALSGGKTPQKLYTMLAKAEYTKKLDWKNIFIFWGDERYVPFSDSNNNSHMAKLSLLNNVPVPAENIFTIPVNFKPAMAASSYEATLRTFFKENIPAFDLILLGIGDNGHTASLFPFSTILQEDKRLVKEVYVDEVKMFRITFTVPLINNAANILFLVTGKEKSEIVKKVFSATKNPEKYPAQLIQGKTIWYLDKAAASQLKIKK